MDGYIEDPKLFSDQREKLNKIEKLTHLSIKPEGDIQPVKKLLRKSIWPITRKNKFYEAVYYRYQRELARYNNKTDRITMMTHNDDLLSRYWMQKSDFDCISSLPFCNISIPVPSDYDTVLTRIYGDYMKYPPVEERGQWHNGIICFDPDLPYKDYFARTESNTEENMNHE